MAKGAGQANPWSLRVVIFGLVCIFIGTILLYTQTDAIDNAFSPKNVSEIKVTGDNSETGDLKIGCHAAIGLSSDEYGNITLAKMDGSSIASESLNTTSCSTDWQPMDSSGKEYYFIDGWEILEQGEYALNMDCSIEEQCENSTVWLVDVSKAQWNIFGEKGLLAAVGLCCFGVITLPIALILYFTNKNKSKIMMVNSEGKIIPLTDLTPETIKEIENRKITEGVDNPFGDTDLSKSEDYVDGREGIESGSLLTTEQVFALMRGDVDEAQKRVGDPFADYNQTKSKEIKETKTSNSKDIAFWDSGDDSQISKDEPKQVSNRDTSIESVEVNKTNSDEGAWKEWDDL